MLPKLLTLEEINGYQSTPAYTSPTTKRLLATARAYWELKKESIEDEKRYVETLWQDKPHLPTLKVFIEALKENAVYSAILDDHTVDVRRLVESLERQLPKKYR